MEQLPEHFISGPSNIPIMSTPGKEKAAWRLPSRSDAYHASSDASLFSTSLPVLSQNNFNEFDQSGRSIDDGFPSLSKLRLHDESKDPLEDMDPSIAGSFLPGNEDALLAGLMDDFDLNGLPTQLEDLDDDFFGSGGGLEIESETQENLVNSISRLDMSDNISGNNVPIYGFANGVGAVSGEHPYGEHPSRTLFVRNINSNVEDSELKALFEQFGDIRTLYAACKHRGFVMISYYDIRAARTAMRALQNKPLRRRKLDIHFSIPKDNPSEKDINQGTLVVFNLDASVSNDDLRQIFGTYGEVKEIRETPHKRHHKFIEFYDVRAAEAALKALNRSDIAGKRIKLEPSRPGGTRRSLMLQLSQEQDCLQVGSPIGNSSPGSWPNFGSPVEQNSLHGYSHSPNLGGLSPVGNNHLHGYSHSPNLGGLSPVGNNHLHGYNQTPNLGGLSPVGSNHLPGLASILPSHLTSPVKIAPIGKDPSRISHVNQILEPNLGAYQQHFSVPDPKLSSSPAPTSSYSDSKQSSVGTLSGPQFLWGSPTIHSEHLNASAWVSSLKGRPLPSRGQGIGYPYTSQRGSFLGSHSHHVGSAPSGIQMERHFGFFPESPESSYVNQVPFGVMNFDHNNGNRAVSIGAPGAMNLSAAFAGNFTESGSPNSRMMSLSRNGPIYFGNGSFGGMGGTGNDGMIDRGRRRVDSGSQMDNKRQYQLDLEKIRSGEDTRTTLMIKNIPNKYTSKMLLESIDETHKNTYDFLYLPIDFKNKCNVGYAFINMVSPSHIVSFYEAFNGKRWEKFNSEKVASLAYARIQGKIALVSHFQNSSLMNEDKRCRPILFQSECHETDDVAGFPSGNLNVFICQAHGSYVGDSLDSPKGDDSDE